MLSGKEEEGALDCGRKENLTSPLIMFVPAEP
jgi:hypothetical protein